MCLTLKQQQDTELCFCCFTRPSMSSNLVLCAYVFHLLRGVFRVVHSTSNGSISEAGGFFVNFEQTSTLYLIIPGGD